MIQKLSNKIIQEQLSIFKALYKKAPLIHTDFHISNSEAYDYCKQRRFFVITIPYTIDRKLLVERTFFEYDIKWSLIGGSLKRFEKEDFIAAADRLSEFILPEISLADIEPFAFIENHFFFNGDKCVHEGIAFTGRIRNSLVKNELSKCIRTRGHLIDLDFNLEDFALPHNRKLATQAQNHIKTKATGVVPFHEYEISQNEKYRNRYKIHNFFVKPLMRSASKFLGEVSIEKLNTIIHGTILEDNPTSMIDVACGENTMCDDLATNGTLDLIVGNDISFSQIELLHQSALKQQEVSRLIYTNHDATVMPFANNTFDVALCKNVLHHMPDKSTVQKLIHECTRIARKVVIIEIMDPMYESRWGRLRHKYYTDFLHDAYVHFYNSEDFNKTVNKGVNCIKRFDIKTFRGIYQFAVIEKMGCA